MEIRHEVKQLGPGEREAIKQLFVRVFTAEPWNDDWSDEQQLDRYLWDLTGQSNSLTYGLYEGEELIGLAMGHTKHWYSGTEYVVDELCIRTDKQGKGLGTLFLAELEKEIKRQGLRYIFLQTERTVPAYAFYKKTGFKELESDVSMVKIIQ